MDNKGKDLSNNKGMDDILATHNKVMDDKISSTVNLTSISTFSSKEAATRAISLALIRRERNFISRNTNDWEREQKWKTVSNYNEEETNGCFCYEFDKTLPGINPKTLFITETHESTGDRVWDASILLARFLEKEIRINNVSSLLSSSLIYKDKIQKQKQEEILRVAEIGAGQGLLSLVIASLCPYSKILATDLSFVASRMAINAKRNGFSISTDSLKEEEMISIDTKKKIMLEKMSNITDMKIFTETETMTEYETSSPKKESITEKCSIVQDFQYTSSFKFNITELKWGDVDGLNQAIQWLGDKPHLIVASDLAAQVSLMPSCVYTLNGLIGKDTILYLATNSQRDSTTPLLDGLHQCIDLKIEKINETLLPLTSKWVDVWKVTRIVENYKDW